MSTWYAIVKICLKAKMFLTSKYLSKIHFFVHSVSPILSNRSLSVSLSAFSQLCTIHSTKLQTSLPTKILVDMSFLDKLKNWDTFDLTRQLVPKTCTSLRWKTFMNYRSGPPGSVVLPASCFIRPLL